MDSGLRQNDKWTIGRGNLRQESLGGEAMAQRRLGVHVTGPDSRAILAGIKKAERDGHTSRVANHRRGGT